MALVRARRLVWIGSDVEGEYTAVRAYAKYRVFLRGDNMWAWQKDDQKQSHSVAASWMAREYCQEDLDSEWLSDTEVLPLEWERHPNIRDFKQSGIYRVAWSNPNEWQLLIDRDDSSVHPTEQSAIDAANEHNRKTILGE